VARLPEPDGGSGAGARSPVDPDAPSPAGSVAPGRPRLRLDAVVIGRVQGVGYRYFVIDRARELRLSGWVANRPDGSVHCVAEGPEPLLRELLGGLWNGPFGARVSSVADAWSPATDEFEGFTLRPGGHPGD